MLEQGQVIADCTVIRQLAEHDSRYEYLVMSAQGEKKLVQFRDSANWARSQRQAFHDQIKKLSALNISSADVPIQAIEEGGECYCLYPLPPGSPLQEVLGGELSARAAVELIRELADLLEPAHRQQCFHGGLSPHTIYLEQGRPWLADFSLASLVAFDYRSSVEVEYASPEQIRGESPGMAADIYSLGCLLYALLVGRAPFSGVDAFTVGMQHLNDSLPVLPPPLAFCSELLEGMTIKAAGERLTLKQVREQTDLLLSRDELDQVPPRAELESPSSTRDVDATEDAMAMVARIEDQLRQLESGSVARNPIGDDRQQEEDLSVAPATTLPEKNTLPTSRPFFLIIGIIVGFCLGALAFDFFLARPDPVATPQVYPVAAVAPDFDSVTHLWLEGDLAGTERELERLLTNFPDHPLIYNNLAAAAAARGELELAQSWLEQAIVLDPQTATIYRNLGEVYAEMARDSYGRALQLDQPQATLQLNLFSNQGVMTRPLGADTIVARTSDDERGSGVPTPSGLTTPAETELDADDGIDTVTADQERADQESETDETAMIVEMEKTETETTQDAVTSPGSALVHETESVAVEESEDPVLFLHRWAAAWSAQNVEEYLSFYSGDFIPAGGLDYDEWVAQRQERLQRPDEISVTLVDVDVREEIDGLVQIEVIQDYHSERYSDRTRKLFDLRRKSESWKIERERSLELIHR